MKNKLFRRFFTAQFAVLFFLTAGSLRAAAPAGQKILAGHVPSAIARLNLQSMGDLSTSTNLRLAIGLPLRNQGEMADLLREIYDPGDPHYHHFLTPEQFTQMFGPSEADYQAVVAFVQTNGLTVAGTYSNRMLLDVNGTVADIEKAFHVTLRMYQHPTQNRTFYAPDVEPTVPSALPILDVNGLNNYVLPRSLIEHRPVNASSLNQSLYGSAPDGSGTYFGNDFRDAYVPGVSLDGEGQTVALFECDDYFDSDISQYIGLARLPAVPLQRVLVEGFEPPPAAGDGGNSEVALDIEMVNCMAPGLSKIIVYETPDDTTAYDGDMLAKIAQDDLANQISSSWLIGDSPQYAQFYAEFALQGQSFFQASGDEDAYFPGVFQYEDGTNVTLVGGTTLSTTGPNGKYVSETVWNWGNEYGAAGAGIGSGGGVSTNYPIPSWQMGIDMSANGGSTTMRNVPDVAMTADNIFIVADDGVQQSGIGGTSCAAPLWAGFMALVNQQAVAAGNTPIGFINPAIYAIGKGPSYANDFHDIATGNNFSPESPTKYPAVAGYDLCTGWGSPNGANLINDLSGSLVRNGFLTLSVNPPSGSALLYSSPQNVFVTVNDVSIVTNATVTAVMPGVTNLTLLDDGEPPDVAENDGIYSATFQVPASGNSLTMTVMATATNEIGVTNVINYSLAPIPSNDDFANAIKVPVAGSSYYENNTFATIEAKEPAHNGDRRAAASLWWWWTPANNTNVLIDTIGSKVDTVLAVYTGDTLASLQPVTGANGSLAQFQPAQVSFNAQAGTAYRIAVASVNSNSVGSVALNVVPGGTFDTNPPVVSITGPQNGLTIVSPEGPIISVSGTASDSGPNASGVSQVFVSVNGSSFVASGTANWSSLISLEPGALQPGLKTITIQAQAVDAAGNFSAPTSIEVSYLVLGPANDFFANALPLTANPEVDVGSNVNATKENGEPNIAGIAGGKSVWWYYQPPGDGVLTLSTTNSTFDTLLGLYTGNDVADLTAVAENDDAYPGASGGFSFINQAVKGGQMYHIAVDGYGGASGTISLNYSFVPTTVYHLTVSNTPGGTVQLTTINTLGGTAIVPEQAGDFANGSTVTLTALPDISDQFNNWTGDISSSANPLPVTMNGDMNLTANFGSIAYTDGFESGSLSKPPWITAGDAPWFVQTNVVDQGQYAARSGVIGDNQSSSLLITTNFFAGLVSFDFKVSSETNWDALKFYVDANLVRQWSGEVGWDNFAYPLTAGTHTLEWSYVKDPTGSSGLDAAFIDDVNLPISASGNATPPQLQLQRQIGGFQMTINGQANQQYIIQTSTDLKNWQNISTNAAADGIIQINIPANTTNRAQFYRAMVP